MLNHGLSEPYLKTIRTILSQCKSQIEKAAIFGSRATGNYKEYSDIDIVLYGDINQSSVNNLLTLFEDSSLPYKVDIIAYNLINNEKLKLHIDKVMLPIF